MPDFFVLVKASGRRIKHVLMLDNLDEAREEQVGFANNSDNGVATLTTDREIADKWEKSCVDEIHKQNLDYPKLLWPSGSGRLQ